MAKTWEQTSLSFEEFMEFALYDLEFGYYQNKTQRSGRRGDFITSVEVGPLFGELLARRLDTWWEELGCPEPFCIFDVGAGVGTLARTFVEANPNCLSTTKYFLVEKSEGLRKEHPLKELNSISSHAEILSIPKLPTTIQNGIVIANELLDNLAVQLFELTDLTSQEWMEVRVKQVEATKYEEVLSLATSSQVKLLEEVVPSSSVNCRYPVRVPLISQAREFISQTLKSIEKGGVIVFDYGVEKTAEFFVRPWAEWLRTYQGQNRGNSPYESVGQQDITCEIPIDQLPLPTAITRQKDYLGELGIYDLLAEPAPSDISKIQNLKDAKLFSRKPEAEALLDPQGLGSHFVAEWAI